MRWEADSHNLEAAGSSLAIQLKSHIIDRRAYDNRQTRRSMIPTSLTHKEIFHELKTIRP